MVNKHLLGKFNGNPPVSEQDLVSFRSSTGLDLPEDYSDFLKFINGGEAFIGGSYAILYRLEDLMKHNKDYGFPDFHPNYFLFGSDGGGDAYAFNTRRNPWSVCVLPFIGNDECETESSRNFSEFLENLAGPTQAIINKFKST